MASRRRRKRGRRRAAEPAGRGDRLPAPRPGGQGAGCGLWRDATRSELLLLRQAINQGWPIPPARRGPILADALASHDSADSRRAIAMCRVLLAAHRANIGGR
jgi:hypothetical protein